MALMLDFEMFCEDCGDKLEHDYNISRDTVRFGVKNCRTCFNDIAMVEDDDVDMKYDYNYEKNEINVSKCDGE